jgi:hypothetical protein
MQRAPAHRCGVAPVRAFHGRSRVALRGRTPFAPVRRELPCR